MPHIMVPMVVELVLGLVKGFGVVGLSPQERVSGLRKPCSVTPNLARVGNGREVQPTNHSALNFKVPWESS